MVSPRRSGWKRNGSQMQKNLLQEKHRETSLTPTGASSRPLHLCHIRFFLLKGISQGFSKLPLLPATAEMRRRRCRLCHRLSHLTFSSLSSVFTAAKRACGEGGGDPLALSGRQSFFSRSNNSSVSPLLRPVRSLCFQFCSARRRGISAACVCHCTKHSPRSEIK